MIHSGPAVDPEADVCQKLPELVNGHIVYSPDTNAPFSLEGTNATHICDPGFVLNGTVIRTCQNDRNFDKAPPRCQGESVTINTVSHDTLIHSFGLWDTK